MFRVVLVNILFFMVYVLHGQTFAEMQLRNSRVYTSMRNADKTLRKEFEKAGVSYPPRFIYWRSFKTEKQIELWASDDPYKPHVLIKTYDICRLSGKLGFKFREGDEQIPEGFYYIDHFNPYSNYFLSFRLSYPNGVDSFWGERYNLGGQIYVHGECQTIGCLPMTDTVMQEIYWIAVQAQSYQGFGARIPIHIFPFRPENETKALRQLSWAEQGTDFKKRWSNLFFAYYHFERAHFPAKAYHDGKGFYLFDTLPPKVPRILIPIYWNPKLTYAAKAKVPLEILKLSRFLKPAQKVDREFVIEVTKEAIETGTNYTLKSRYVEILPDSGEFRPFNAPRRYRKVIDTVFVNLKKDL